MKMLSGLLRANELYNFCFGVRSGVLLAVLGLLLGVAQAHADTSVLGTSALIVGSDADTNSIVLAITPATGTWTATTSDSWLHLDAANQSGIGSTNVIFSYDANPGATRVGTLTVSGQTLTVTQAGSGFVSARPPISKYISVTDFGNLAVDDFGNLYIPVSSTGPPIQPGLPSGPNTIVVLIASNGVSAPLQIPSLNQPSGVAVDEQGNVFIADTGNNAVEEWTGGNLITLVSSNLSSPLGVAVDNHGNVFIADSGNGAIKEWNPGSSNVTTLVTGLSYPSDVALDVAGNVYFSDSGNYLVKEWIAATTNVATLATADYGPSGVAVDGSGNVYVGVPGSFDMPTYLLKWTAATGTAAQLYVPSLPVYGVGAVAVNGAGDIYFTDPAYHVVYVLPNTFVDITARIESPVSSTDAWPVLLPVTDNTAATSDQSWLTVDGMTNGILSVSFSANSSGADRTAHVSLLGQKIPVTQPALPTVQMTGPSIFQLTFSNAQQSTFTVSSTTDLTVPVSNWTVVSVMTNVPAGQFQFTSQPTPGDPQRFYRVTSP
ncbi:MAG TPA: BACON domain-containing carbohydrate-binding protein [Verrucomicrobiae bacterium]